jgi:trehalose-phosphatase
MALRVQREPATAEVVAMAALLKAEVRRLVTEPWLVLEDKGPALTFHFRAAPDIDAARERVTTAVDSVDPGHLLQRFPGRRSLEVRAGDASTKATTLANLIRQLQPAAVLMLGDDHHDSGAFAHLRRARAAGHVAGLAIGVAGSAAHAHEVATHADLLLAGPDDVAVFLALLSDVMTRIRDSSASDR